MAISLKELFKRNMPVLLIGLSIVIIFAVIIITSQLRPPTTPTLIETDQDELIALHTNFVGPDTAKLFIVEFTDLQCPACKIFHETMKELVATYPNQITWAIRHFPLDEYQGAEPAARAAQAAGNQGKFWEFVDMVFQNPDKTQEGDFVRYADILDMDLKQFRTDFNDPGLSAQVQKDISYGKSLGVNSTPTFFINGKQIVAGNPADLKSLIEQELMAQNVNVVQLKEDKVLKEEQQAQQQFTDIYTTVDQRFGIKEIEFVDGNFSPRNSSATAGQLVRFSNNSDSEITLTQIMDKYEALNKGVILQPGEYFEFRLELRKYGLWTYRNEGNPIRASIMVGKLPEDLKALLPAEE